MASIRNVISNLNATLGPNVRRGEAASKTPSRIVVASAKEEPIVVSQVDQLLFDAFGKDSLVIPIGVVTTSIILVSGLFSLQSNNKAQQQLFMRLRVGAQGITVLAMMASLAVQERQKALGVYRR